MRIFGKLCKKNIGNKGVTLIELICAIAILSVISTVIVGLVLVSANSYQRSVQEIEVQQEAQFAANLIGDLVKDATNVSGDASKIEIEKGGVLYTITYDDTAKKIEIDDGTGKQLMAEHVDGIPNIPVLTSGNTYEVSMSVTRSDASDTMNVVNSNNQRNEDVPAGVAEGEIYATIISPSEMILEPNVEKEIIFTVTGTPDKRVNWTLTGNTDPNTIIDDRTIKIGMSETASTLYVTGETVQRKRDGVTPAANTTIIVYIRRVTGVTLETQLLGGADGEAGAHYKFTANVTGVNLERKPTMETDYITPYAIDWTCDYRVNGVTVANFNDYFAVTARHEGNGENENYVEVYLNRKIEPGSYFIIQANSAHGLGRRETGAKGNKSGIQYAWLYDNHMIEGHIYTLYPGNFYRGSDQRQGELNEWTVKSLISNQYGVNAGDLSVFKEVRYKITGTNDWTPWITLSEGGSAIRIHEDSWMFACDKDYDIEIRFGCITNWGTKLYPTALGENAYTIRTTLEHSKLRFDVASDRFSQNDIYGMGPISNPIRMSAGSFLSFNVNSNEAYRQAETGIRWERFNQSLILKVQRLDGGTWNDVNLDYRNGNFWGEVWVNVDSGTQLSQMFLTDRQFRFNRTGIYRILIGIGNETGGSNIYIKNYIHNGWYGYYVTEWNQNYHLWNEATGEGIFYISVE